MAVGCVALHAMCSLFVVASSNVEPCDLVDTNYIILLYTWHIHGSPLLKGLDAQYAAYMLHIDGCLYLDGGISCNWCEKELQNGM